jgi:hypothetical protein
LLDFVVDLDQTIVPSRAALADLNSLLSSSRSGLSRRLRHVRSSAGDGVLTDRCHDPRDDDRIAGQQALHGQPASTNSTNRETLYLSAS